MEKQKSFLRDENYAKMSKREIKFTNMELHFVVETQTGAELFSSVVSTPDGIFSRQSFCASLWKELSALALRHSSVFLHHNFLSYLICTKKLFHLVFPSLVHKLHAIMESYFTSYSINVVCIKAQRQCFVPLLPCLFFFRSLEKFLI